MQRRSVVFAVIGVCTLAASAGAQAPRGRITGVVFDSVRSLPLAGATIELVSVADRGRLASSAVSDSLGRYTIADVAPGHYIAGFLHPMLDSLGLAMSQRQVDVGDAAADVRFDLAVPSAERLHRTLCRSGEHDSSGVVLGYVLDAATLEPVHDASITAQWSEFSVGAGFHHSVLTRTGIIAPGGWFAICGVPAGSDVLVRASAHGDTSGAIQVDVPSSRIARRTIFLARSAPNDSAPSTAGAAGTAAAGAVASIRGWIRSEGGVPIAGARVGIFGSDSVAITNADGGFQLRGVPGGTQTLVTRAIGFVPDERAVDLTRLDTPITIGLNSVRNFLDTVHVRAGRLDVTAMVGFDQRRRLGTGRFMTADEISHFAPQRMSDLLRHVTSLQLVENEHGPAGVRFRGDGRLCKPAIFVDGNQLVNWELSDLNGIVQPGDAAAVEVYTAALTPPEFATRDACGAVVVWTKPVVIKRK